MFREIVPGNLYHVYNRATEKRTIFYTQIDYAKFLDRMFRYKREFGVKMLSYVILPNHFHFLLQEPEIQRQTLLTSDVEYKPRVNQYQGSKIGKFMSLLANSYTKYFNLKNEHSGRIFQGKYKPKIINDNNYLYSILAYINLNPLKHKIVDNINDWPYSSYNSIVSGVNNKLIDSSDLVDKKNCKEFMENNIEIIKNMDLEF